MTNIHFMRLMQERHNTDEAGVRRIMAARGAKTDPIRRGLANASKATKQRVAQAGLKGREKRDEKKS